MMLERFLGFGSYDSVTIPDILKCEIRGRYDARSDLCGSVSSIG
jgi:hypothetical protein